MSHENPYYIVNMPFRKGFNIIQMNRVDQLLTPILTDSRLRPASAIKERLALAKDSINEIYSASDALYQHAVLCQTCLPFRDPGDATRQWERRNGGATLQLVAGEAMHPELRHFVRVGLPYGPKARMILMHINQLALRQRRPEICIAESLTAFTRSSLGLDPKGRNMRMVKDQLARLATTTFRIGFVHGDHAVTMTGQIVSAFDIWFPRVAEQRVMWPSVICLSAEYFMSLKAHAVPLSEAHIAALSHSALALDIYAWLVNRLHRVHPAKPVFIPWHALHAQFGSGYRSATKFRQVFRIALNEVQHVYNCSIEQQPQGLLLRNSKLPVAYRQLGD